MDLLFATPPHHPRTRLSCGTGERESRAGQGHLCPTDSPSAREYPHRQPRQAPASLDARVVKLIKVRHRHLHRGSSSVSRATSPATRSSSATVRPRRSPPCTGRARPRWCSSRESSTAARPASRFVHTRAWHPRASQKTLTHLTLFAREQGHRSANCIHPDRLLTEIKSAFSPQRPREDARNAGPRVRSCEALLGC